ncbi:MAG: sugar-binding protein [Candidatus Promineifilaceae bacterium]|nr:sugar-binding protein [Candidatus Promineifilaceae bacterium]
MRSRNQYDDQGQWEEWDDWEQPAETGRSYQGLFGVVVGLLIACILAACAAGTYLFLLPTLEPEEQAAPPLIPTLPGSEEEEATTPATVPVEQETPPDADEPAPPAPTADATDPTTVVAAPVTTPPTIDGRLSEWSDVSATTSHFLVHQAESWDGSRDLEATWRLAWDADNLYVAVNVVDDVHVQTQSGNLIFRGDSVEMQIDTAPQAEATRVNPSTYQILLSPGSFGAREPSAWRFRGTEAGQIRDAIGHNIVVEAAPTDAGYTLEAAIPWRDLNVTPTEGMVLGLALNANDNDSPGEAVQEVMLSNSVRRTLTNPQTWGQLVLE